MVKLSFKSTVKIKVKNEIDKSRVTVRKNHISSLAVPSQELLPTSEPDPLSSFSSIIRCIRKGDTLPRSVLRKMYFQFFVCGELHWSIFET